jgi:hypothetical protein
VSEIEQALRALVDRLDEIHADPAFKSVWVVNQIHAGPYRGPTYVDALARARAALSPATTSPEASSPPGSAPPASPSPSGA